MPAKGCTICGSPIPYYTNRTLCGWHLYEQAQSQGPEDPALDIEDGTGRTPRERMEA